MSLRCWPTCSTPSWPCDVSGRERLADVAGAAGAWVQTYIDCQELEEFSFDPAVDPVPLR